MSTTLANTNILRSAVDPVTTDNYRELLESRGVSYQARTYYLHVGEIQGTQGWLLHLSVVRSELARLLDVLLPVLEKSGVPFKIPEDKETARTLLDGDMGSHLVGKVITLYPPTAAQALALAQKLILLTASFEGPAVPTDFHLGGSVYTRYGGFNPIVKPGDSGKDHPYIYDSQGRLVPDLYPMPFRLPEGIAWPFSDIVSHCPKPVRKIFHKIYRPTALLKSDTKGNVYKALRLGRFFRVSWCVIKEAKRRMWSDDQGRDMAARLRWQEELHQLFQGRLPLPKVFDLFEEEGDTYLVMEYLRGPALYNKVLDLYKNGAIWVSQSGSVQHEVLDYVRQLLYIIQVFHESNYVHRDITPVNFIVGKRGQVHLIDIELAYSIAGQKPRPPFEMGTYGFMSPQQEAFGVPSVKDDIYALGCTLIVIFTGLTPFCFDVVQRGRLQAGLLLLIRDPLLADILTRCLAADPRLRPTIAQVQTVVNDYTGRMDNSRPYPAPAPDYRDIRETIQQAIVGLCYAPTVINDNLWYTNARSHDPNEGGQCYEFEKNPGLADGIAGVLYLLAKAKAAGFAIDPCMTMYHAGWSYLSSFSEQEQQSPLSAGLYGGTAGLAVALSAALDAGILPDTAPYRARIDRWLSDACTRPDLASGEAGRGIALLQCRRYLDKEVFEERIDKTIRFLLEDRSRNKGIWIQSSLDNKHWKPSHFFAEGNTGIIWFLLEYTALFPDPQTQFNALDALDILCRSIKPVEQHLRKNGSRTLLDPDSLLRDGFNGLVLCLLKAYEQTRHPDCRRLAEELLHCYPREVVHGNFTQSWGLAALGELYLEAFRITGNEEWWRRARWLAQVLGATYQESDQGTGYWLNNNQRYPTAYLLTGNSGILHFLIRFHGGETIGTKASKFLHAITAVTP